MVAIRFEPGAYQNGPALGDFCSNHETLNYCLFSLYANLINMNSIKFSSEKLLPP